MCDVVVYEKVNAYALAESPGGSSSREGMNG